MPKRGNNCVPIYSGGLDSTVLLYLLLKQNVSLKPLSVNYGQRHAKEIESARYFAERLNLHLEVADLRGITHLIAGSSQTSPDVDVPEGHYAEESMKATVVPNRNMIMLAVAIGYAVSQGVDNVAYGAHDGDHAIYPDCRPVFASAMDTAAMLADWREVRVLRPFISNSKADIARLGDQLGVPMHLTWSCYKGGEIHCGKCGTCVERREAFELAGVRDITAYETDAKANSFSDPARPVYYPNKSEIVAADGSPAKDGPTLIDMEKVSRIERALEADGLIEPLPPRGRS